MYQQPSRKVDFRRKRDFSQIFTDSFKYFKFNLKGLFSAVLLLAGPLALLAGGFKGYFDSMSTRPSNFFGMRDFGNMFDMLTNIMILMLPYLILIYAASIVYHAVVNRYLILSQMKAEGEVITIPELLKYLPKDAWRLFYNYLLLTLVSLAVMIGVMILAFIPILGILMIFVGFLLVVPNVVYAVTNSSYLVLRDEILITRAFGKTWRYMRGNYWYTWLLMVVAYIIVSIVTVIFALPQMITQWVTMLSRFNPENMGSDGGDYAVLFIIFGMIAALGQFIAMPLLNIFSTLNYHSHEEEEEGTGLKQRIDEIGTSV